MDYFSSENPVTISPKQLGYIRQVLGESQRDFSRRFQVSPTAIRTIENRDAPSTGPLAISICLFAQIMGIKIPTDERIDVLMAGGKVNMLEVMKENAGG